MSEFVHEEFDRPTDLYTPTKAVLRGIFQLSKAAVPYFQANLTLEEVQRHLKLVEDLPAEYRENWTLEELFSEILIGTE